MYCIELNCILAIWAFQKCKHTLPLVFTMKNEHSPWIIVTFKCELCVKCFPKHKSMYTCDEFYLNFSYIYTYIIHILLFSIPFFFILLPFPIFCFRSLTFFFIFVLSCSCATFSTFHFNCVCVCVFVCLRSSFEARELCRLFWRLKWQMWVLLLEKYMLFTCMCERWESLKYFACFCIFQMTVLTHTHGTHHTCSRSLLRLLFTLTPHTL